MIYGMTLILLSIIAIPSLLISKKPNAKEFLEAIEPYQSWTGLVFSFLGIWGFVSSAMHIDWLVSNFIWWITMVIGNLIQAILGFMLSYSMLHKLFLSKKERMKEKAILIRSKIAPKQGKLGVLAIVIGVWMICASFLFSAI